LRCQSRLWRIDKLQSEVSIVLNAASSGIEFLGKDGAEIRFQRLVGEAADLVLAVQRETRERLRGQITRDRIGTVARAENLEELLTRVLRVSFPAPARVDRTPGSGERGADIVIRIPDPFDPEDDALILVQLKDHEGETGAEGIEQLRTAIAHYGTGDTRQGRVTEAVLATLAPKFAEGVSAKAADLAIAGNVKVRLVNGPQLLEIIADGLLGLAANSIAVR
jgi:hypothetical protein